MTQEISSKNTKNQILEAYNELLAKVQEQSQADAKTTKKRETEAKITENASQHSVESIMKNLADTKFSIVKALDDLEEKMVAKYKKLAEIQEAIEVEKANLENIHQIAANADSLAALIMAQNEKKSFFEEEAEKKRKALEEEIENATLQWEKEREEFKQNFKEEKLQARKEWEREEEEYNYALRLNRAKEEDLYEEKKSTLEKELKEKKAAFEKELSEREADLKLKEQEYSELKAGAESFPTELEEAVSLAKETVKRDLELKFGHQAELTQKDIEGEKQLNKQIISNLENKIREQEELIKRLSQKTDEAGVQVKDIAIKAIEGAASRGFAPEKQSREREDV